MADVAILNPSVEAVPDGYVVPGAQEILIRAVSASVDGSGAGSAFLPCLQLVSPSGQVMWTAPTPTSVAAGGSADVSWFPRVSSPAGGIPLWTNLLFDLTLGGDATLDYQASRAWTMVQSAGVFLSTIFLFLFIILDDPGTDPTPFVITGLPSSGIAPYGDYPELICTGWSVQGGLVLPTATFGAALTANGRLFPLNSTDPQIDNANYTTNDIIFNGCAVYPWALE